MFKKGYAINKAITYPVEVVMICSVLTFLIQSTYLFANQSMVANILANVVGRSGTIYLLLFLGKILYRERNRLDVIFYLLVIYLFSTAIYFFYYDFFILKYNFDIAVWKNIIHRLLVGSEGNVWVIYSALVFSILLKFCDKFIVLKCENRIDIIAFLCAIFLLSLFCYLHIYTSVLKINSGLLLIVNKIFYTTRTPYLFGIPLIIIGAVIERGNIKVNNLPGGAFITLLLYLVWIYEVLYINKYYNISNCYITAIGFVAITKLYTTLSCRNVLEKDYKIDKGFFIVLFLFSINFSIFIFLVKHIIIDKFIKGIILWGGWMCLYICFAVFVILLSENVKLNMID